MRILVTGAAGYIGGRMVEALTGLDWVEAVIGTDIRDQAPARPKYRYLKQDIRQPLAELLQKERIDTVVHTAYVLPPIHARGLMEEINKGGTRNVLESAVVCGVKQILYTSSTTAYGFWPDNDTPLTEESPLRGNDDFTYAKNKKEIEGMMREFMAAHPEIAVTIVRPCFVVGPGFKNPLAEHLRKKFVLLPAGTQPWQFVHEDDLINVMVLLLEKKLAGAFNVTGDGTMTFTEMVLALGNVRIPVPWAILYPLNNLAWLLRLSFVTKFPSQAMRMMINPWLASNDKLKRATGYKFQYDTRSAFIDFVERG